MNYLLTLLLTIAAIHGNTITLTARATAQQDGSLVIRLVLPNNAQIIDQQIDGGDCAFGGCATTASLGETRTMTTTIQLDSAAQLGAVVTDPYGHAAYATVRLYRWYLP